MKAKERITNIWGLIVIFCVFICPSFAIMYGLLFILKGEGYSKLIGLQPLIIAGITWVAMIKGLKEANEKWKKKNIVISVDLNFQKAYFPINMKRLNINLENVIVENVGEK